MFVPSGFLPSSHSLQDRVDRMDAPNDYHPLSSGDSGLTPNALYDSEAQHTQDVAPFLAKNMARARATRDYEVLPGGVCQYKPGAPRPKANYPASRDVMGGSSPTSTIFTAGRPFSLGRAQ